LVKVAVILMFKEREQGFVYLDEGAWTDHPKSAILRSPCKPK